MHTPRDLVVMVGGWEPYREQPSNEPKPRDKCSRGCRNRDLQREQKLEYNRWCSECQTWTWDPENYRIPGSESYEAKQAERLYLKRLADEKADREKRIAALTEAVEAAEADSEVEDTHERVYANG